MVLLILFIYSTIYNFTLVFIYSTIYNQARSYGGARGATAPPNVFLAPSREIWEVFVIVDRREFTSTSWSKLLHASKKHLRSKDASKKELLGASLRYIHKGDVRERAIGFIELKALSLKSW